MIGVFDSGVGGLTVLSQIRQRLPEISLIYVADQAYSPYGDLSAAQVLERSQVITQWLVDQGCSVIVVACNTATAIAIDRLREQFSVPIVGVEPGVKPAALSSKTGKVAILATENTLASQRYSHLISSFLPNVSVISQACSGLADAIESRPDDIGPLLARYTSAFAAEGVDQVVLGCTHYPLVTAEIRALLPSSIDIVDTSGAIASEVARRAEVAVHPKTKPSIDLWTTGNPLNFQNIIGRYQTLSWLKDHQIALLKLTSP